VPKIYSYIDIASREEWRVSEKIKIDV